MLRITHPCFQAVTFILFFLVSVRLTSAQIDAPGAFSDYSGCRHHTCTWVPWSTQKTFRKGNLSYFVDHIGKDDTGGDFVLTRGGHELLRFALEDLSASVSVVWSPDGKSFAVTWSNGGGSGEFEVQAYRDQGGTWKKLPAPEVAFNSFKKLHWCETRGDNVQAYRWSEDSRSLVLVLSVYPTSDCGKETGFTEGYLVEAVTGKIEKVWSRRQLQAYIRLHPEG